MSSTTPLDLLDTLKRRWYIEYFFERGLTRIEKLSNDKVIVSDRDQRFGIEITQESQRKFLIREFYGSDQYEQMIFDDWQGETPVYNHKGSIYNIQEAVRSVLESWLDEWVRDGSVMIKNFGKRKDVHAILQAWQKNWESPQTSTIQIRKPT